MKIRLSRYDAAYLACRHWIVAPTTTRIMMLTLAGVHYAVHDEPDAGEQATLLLLTGFAADVDAIFAAA